MLEKAPKASSNEQTRSFTYPKPQEEIAARANEESKEA
jgi:hypothetical protein